MSILISAKELNQLLSENTHHEKLAILDCRFSLADFELGKRLYAQAHIPGAQNIDMEQQLAGTKGEHGGRHPLPNALEFDKTMRQLGISDTTLVVAYDDNRLAGAARLWWLLQYFGHQQIRILDGGFKAWTEKGYTTSSQYQHQPLGHFEAVASPDQTRDYQWLSGHLQDADLQLIDSREAPRYEGLEEPIDPVAGHIPGALNYPWQGVTDEQGFALAEQLQQQRWRDLDRNKPALVYCGSGITACVNLLSLKLAGFENARLYPGSWSDWCSYSDSPKKP